MEYSAGYFSTVYWYQKTPRAVLDSALARESSESDINHGLNYEGRFDSSYSTGGGWRFRFMMESMSGGYALRTRLRTTSSCVLKGRVVPPSGCEFPHNPIQDAGLECCFTRSPAGVVDVYYVDQDPETRIYFIQLRARISLGVPVLHASGGDQHCCERKTGTFPGIRCGIDTLHWLPVTHAEELEFQGPFILQPAHLNHSCFIIRPGSGADSVRYASLQIQINSRYPSDTGAGWNLPV